MMTKNYTATSIKLSVSHHLTVEDVLVSMPYYTDRKIPLLNIKTCIEVPISHLDDCFIISEYGFDSRGSVSLYDAFVLSELLSSLGSSGVQSTLKIFVSNTSFQDVCAFESACSEILHSKEGLETFNIILNSDKQSKKIEFESSILNGEDAFVMTIYLNEDIPISDSDIDLDDGEARLLNLKNTVFECDYAQSIEASDALADFVEWVGKGIFGGTKALFKDIVKCLKEGNLNPLSALYAIGALGFIFGVLFALFFYM